VLDAKPAGHPLFRHNSLQPFDRKGTPMGACRLGGWCLFFLVLAFAAPGASAGETRKLPTIGLAIPVDPTADAPFQKAFRDGLRDLGWVDGRNVTLIVRYANGDPAKYREIIRELIALHVDVLWGEARELKEATTTIPIVSPTMDFGDPVRTGLVASLARPGAKLPARRVNATTPIPN